MLPRGVILVDGFSPGFQPGGGTEAEHDRRLRAVVKVDGKTPTPGTAWAGTTGSAHAPGVALARPSITPSACTPRPGTALPSSTSPGRTWRRTCTTSSTRPGPTRTWKTPSGPATAPGWLVLGPGRRDRRYPAHGPRASLALAFTEIDLADGSGAVPVQLMWSNKDNGPARRIGSQPVLRSPQGRGSSPVVSQGCGIPGPAGLRAPGAPRQQGPDRVDVPPTRREPGECSTDPVRTAAPAAAARGGWRVAGGPRGGLTPPEPHPRRH